jgi:acetolactate synthase-1/2/3 large subunit
MRVCDYIARELVNLGIKNVYGLTGGGASGLNDGFIRNPDINYICFHHEQAAGYAAIGAAKYSRNFSIVNPTTGCGGTNCMTPLLDAWQDGVPVLFISGNVRSDQTTYKMNNENQWALRKYGIQENDIIPMVKNYTTYTHFLNNPNNIRSVLMSAINAMTNGRPGPAWIDIPADVQIAELNEQYTQPIILKLLKFNYEENNLTRFTTLNFMVDKLFQADKPLILAGNGIAQSNTIQQFIRFIEMTKIPFVSTYGARDYTDHANPLNIGCIGVKGSRAGNMALMKSDTLLVLGSSLTVCHIGYDKNNFAPNAYKMIVDISQSELLKTCNQDINSNIVSFNKGLRMDLREFFTHAISQYKLGKL